MLPNFIAQLFLHMDGASELTWTETDFVKKHFPYTQTAFIIAFKSLIFKFQSIKGVKHSVFTLCLHIVRI